MKINKKILEQLFRSCSAVHTESGLKNSAISIWQSDENDNSEWTLNNGDNLQIPACKNSYKGGSLIARYQYDSDGRIVQRINFEGGIPYSVTKYHNGAETETVQLYTYTKDYASPDKAFDKIIDPIIQNPLTSDCWFLNALSVMSKKSWGRELINDAISYDTKTGNVTIRFKHAYGSTKEFTITPKELEEAKLAKTKLYGFGIIPEGTTVYIDGKKELYATSTDELSINSNMIKSQITFVEPDGESYTYTKEELEENDEGNFEGPKYSTGDLTVLALEIAADRSCNEAGFNLGDGAGSIDEVISLFLDETIISEYYSNADVILETPLCIESQKNSDVTHSVIAENMLDADSTDLDNNISSDEIKEKLHQVKNNFDNYICELIIKTPDGGWHAAEILRFEEKDGKEYISYSQPWDEKAEITEDIDSFVQNTLNGISLLRIDENRIVSDLADGALKMGRKSNRTNFVSVLTALYENTEFSPDIKKEDNKYIVKIKDENITVTVEELETAKLSGRYSTNNDEASLLEIAIERYINKSDNKNTISDFTHTNLEDVKIQEILGLLYDNELNSQKIPNLKQAAKKDGLKFAVSNGTYYAVKDITQTPDGKYIISVIQPEDTSVTITFTEEEYKRMFDCIEVY